MVWLFGGLEVLIAMGLTEKTRSTRSRIACTGFVTSMNPVSRVTNVRTYSSALP